MVLHPGHISGPGWPVINPVGNVDPQVWQALARGDEVLVPNDGVATMHHVHAADVAAAFELALTSDGAVGEAFHVVSERALSTRAGSPRPRPAGSAVSRCCDRSPGASSPRRPRRNMRRPVASTCSAVT